MQMQSVLDEEGVIFVDNQAHAVRNGEGGRMISKNGKSASVAVQSVYLGHARRRQCKGHVDDHAPHQHVDDHAPHQHVDDHAPHQFVVIDLWCVDKGLEKVWPAPEAVVASRQQPIMMSGGGAGQVQA